MNILERWRAPIWINSLPTLIHHLVHICGGITVVAVFIAFGINVLLSHVLSTVLFCSIELTTALFKKNWKDSTFDAYQYQFHWVLFVVPISLDLAGILLGILVIGYFILLRKGW